MFFLSGGTGLAYQVIWFKRFAHVWGSSSLAFASVGGSFLFGLGVGAYLLGRFADRAVRPLRWYAFCELAIGVLAIVIPLEIQFLVEHSARFYSSLPDDPLFRFVLQFGVTLLVVGPPCVLMGGTLPLLIRELTSRDGRLDQATGWLYAINTFGAAAGCFLTGFWLLPAMGLSATNLMAATVNLSIGCVAVWMTQRKAVQRQKPHAARGSKEAASTAAPSAATLEAAPWGLSLLGLYVAVTLSGLGALVLEMTWSRQLALLLGGSSYTYSATLFVVLVGIATGSLAFHLFLRRFALDPWLPVVVIGALAISCLLSKLLMPQLAEALMSDNRSPINPSSVLLLRRTLAGNALVCMLASFCLELIPSIAMGILFPLFVDLTRASASRVGRSVGDVYAWNTLGSIAGASLTSVLLFPWIGTMGSIAFATGLYVATLVLVLPLENRPQRLLSVGCLTVGAGSVAIMMIPQNPIYTNVGMYLYGTHVPNPTNSQILYFSEGPSSNVLITQQGPFRSLRVNGKVDAGDGGDMITQASLAYMPRIIKPDARDVLVIGFGSGTTSGVSLLFPGTRVTCCEIEPAVYRAASLFGHVNHRPHEQTREALLARNATVPENERLSDEQLNEQARFQVVFGDGRTTLQGSDQKYDLIISEPSNPWLAGVSNLFTREFFYAAREHLKEGGLLAQWVQLYNLREEEYYLILRTLRSEFPHFVVCSVGPGDTLLLASERPIAPDPAALAELQKIVDQSPEIREDLSRFSHTTDLRQVFLSHFVADEQKLDHPAGVDTNLPLNTDLNLRLEFLAPLRLFTSVERDNAMAIYSHMDVTRADKLAADLNIVPDTFAYQQMRGLRELNRLQYAKAVPLFQRAMEMDPEDSRTLDLLEESLREAKDPKLAIETLGKLSKAHPDSEPILVRLAEWLGANNDPTGRVKLLADYVARQPKSLLAREKLTDYHISRGDHAAALEVLLQLDALRPNHAPTLATLGGALIAVKRSAEAVPYLRRALELDSRLNAKSGNSSWANDLAWIYATSMDPALRNGPEAVRLATEACEAVNYKQMAFVDTLACAYAENGQFDEALRREKEFVEQMKIAAADEKTIQAAQDRVKLFEAGQPYHEP